MRALQLASYVPRLDLNGEATCKDPLSAYRSDVYPTPKDPRNCTCASACFFIHIGAIYRSGTYIAVHHPYFEKGKFGNLPQGDAKLAFDQLQQISRSYMNEMEVPKYIQDIVFSTPSDQSILLDENTVKTYFLGDIPYLHEWLQNKCSKLSPAERGRYNRYSSQTQKTKEGWDDYSVLIHKIWDENDCIATIRKKNRLAAYEKYFGTKLTDYGRHNFSRWSQAPSYLNRLFSEILSAEKFKEVKSENSVVVKPNRTPS